MAKRINTLETFIQLANHLSAFEAKGRSGSADLLIWFLHTVYRLDEVESQDAVCDESGDNGIDALTVDDDQNQIVVLQAKRRDNAKRRIGDSTLRDFVGSLSQLSTRTAAEKLESRTKSHELRRLLVDHDVARKIEDGYTVHPIFVANVPLDKTAEDFLDTIAPTGNQGPLDVWDLNRLGPVLAQLDTDWLVDEPVRLKAIQSKLFVDGPKYDPRLIFASVPATQLVSIPGIGDLRVFAQNVRLSLGRTRVNKEIIESVKTADEHSNFLAFHNGLTIVAQKLTIRGTQISMNRYSVCNGCQSLITFHNNRDALTDALEVLVRFVRVGDDRDLSETIAYRTNNQNSISMRDMAANDRIQVQLKADYDGNYGHDCTYIIKRGSIGKTQRELPNEFAGQLLLSLYSGRPWEAHQKYRIFRDAYNEIFRYGISAHHIRLAQLIHEEVTNEAPEIDSEPVRKYGLTRFLLLYLVGEVLRQEADGTKLLHDPEPYLVNSGGANQALQHALLINLRQAIKDVIITVNFYIQDQGDGFDYKSQFKSREAVSKIRREVLETYRKDKARGKADPFTLPT